MCAPPAFGFHALSQRSAEGIGFCSEDMALELASAARDRCLHLEPVLRRWPDAIGVACTATIVSHYRRKGAYRVRVVYREGPQKTNTHLRARLRGRIL